MKKKIILGILSSDPYNDKEIFLNQMRHNGFSVYSVSSKIREIARYLLKIEDADTIPSGFIDKIRKRGYAVNKLYWINLLLTSIADKENGLLIDDMWEEDLHDGYIVPIISDPILVHDMKYITYPENTSELSIKSWIEEIQNKLYNIK